MKIIIVGCGKVGEAIVDTLCSEGHDVAVVDTNKSVIERINYSYDVRGITGSGIITDTLKNAGAVSADLLIATASPDEINLLSCTIAKEMGTKRCIARVRDPAHNAQAAYLAQHLGISMTVNPELLASREIGRLLLMPSAIEVDTFAKGRIDLVQIRIAENSVMRGKALADMSRVLKSKILICAIQRPGIEETIIPSGSFVLEAGDKIYVTATHREMNSFFREVGYLSHKIRNVLIVGGGKIAYYLALALENTGTNVKIIESNRERCVELANALNKTSVINADGSDQKVLEEEGLLECDSLVALTGIDEDNTIISMYAKLKGVPKVITKINKPELRLMGESVGLESVISPKQLTKELILTYVRSTARVKSSAVRSIYRVADDTAEALEFFAESGSRAIGVPLMKMKLKKNLLIAAIIRQGKAIFPGGSDVIMTGDLVIVVTTNKFINSLDGILE